MNIQSHSLPSSVTDTLEAMVGGGLDDLTLEDIDPTNANLTEDQSEVRFCECVCWDHVFVYVAVDMRLDCHCRYTSVVRVHHFHDSL